jgi:hypothetical protein
MSFDQEPNGEARGMAQEIEYLLLCKHKALSSNFSPTKKKKKKKRETESNGCMVVAAWGL